ncbi:MAG: intradiol ring-cleavage dioxygenase [Solirubrobacterales bacterium]|nr:intradiol ring-cleavage dioxygenase [Solirubrobacterales bacterium]
MNEESKKGLTRRQALTAAGSLGAGAALAGSGVIGKLGDGVEGDLAPGVAEAASCVLTPSMTEGPYFVDELLNRSDITGGQSGLPLELTINVYNADDSCDAYSGAIVDIWHCNAQGSYSDISNAGNGGNTSGQTWLRGLQETDSNGQVKFTTIFPGWYSGRTIHIHLKVRTFDGDTTTYNFNTQLFFSESINNQVLNNVAAYSRSGTRNTTNSNDNIFDADMIVPLTGNITNGYSGSIDIGLQDLPDEGSTTDPDTTTPDDDDNSSDSSVAASLAGVRTLSRNNGSRAVIATVKTREKAKIDARLMRGGKLLARKRTGFLSKGRHPATLRVGRRVASGSAVLRVIVTDKSGNKKTLQRRVHVPRRKG